MKKTHFMLVLFICFVFNVDNVYANKQNPVSELNVNDVTFTWYTQPLSQTQVMKPKITISWKAPASSQETDTTSGILDGDGIHNVEKYNIYMKNLTKNTAEVLLDVVNSTTTSYEVGNDTWLDTGTLYMFRVMPVHEHTYKSGENTEKKNAVYTMDIDNQPKVIALTDLKQEITGEGKSLTVIWDDASSDMNYDILYERGDITNASNMGGKIESVRDKAISYVDTNTKRKKLKYTITHDTIKAGQLYSVMVKPTTYVLDGISIRMNSRSNIVKGTTKIPLRVYEDGDNYVRLVWWGIDTSVGNGTSNDSYTLKEFQIIKKDISSGNEKIIARIYGQDAINIGYYSDAKPTVKSEYKIKIIYAKLVNSKEVTTEMTSDGVVYDSSVIRIVPTKPEIPALGNKLSEDNNAVTDLSTYEGSFYLDTKTNKINLVWNLFKHLDYTKKAEMTDEIITDLDVYYDVWITNSLDLLYDTDCIISAQNEYIADPNNLSNYIKSKDGKNIGYHKIFNNYVTAYKTGSSVLYEEKPIIPNQIYYIKIVAKKKIGDQILESQPTITSIYYDDKKNIFTPGVISKPPLQIKEVSKNTATISFKTNWVEIAKKQDTTQSWYQKVWLKDKQIYFSTLTGAEQIELNTLDDIQIVKNKIPQEVVSEYVYRQMSLGDDIQYEIKIIPYKDLEYTIKEKQKSVPTYSFVEYIKSLQDDSFANGWEKLKPTLDATDKTKNTYWYQKSGLYANTSYLFLIRAYTVDGEGRFLYSVYPTPMIITTLPEDINLNENPVVPNLILVSKKDIQASIKWEYHTAFTYDLVYSTTEDIKTAKSFKYDITTNKPINAMFYTVTVTDLFPDTEYYFWIKAKQVNGSKESEYSNPLVVTTSDILPDPLPTPEGLGVASGKDTVGTDYITIEWNRDNNDLLDEAKKDTSSKVKRAYTYIVEVSDNEEFKDSRKIEVSDTNIGKKVGDDEVISKQKVKINKLTSNKTYYLRIKTKVTVTGETKTQVKTKESSFSDTTTIRTAFVAEYDAGIDETKVTLPDKIIETTVETVWNYKISDFGQVITDIVKKDDFNYIVNMKQTSSGIIQRKISIPYSVIKTLEEKKMNLIIKTDNMDFKIPIKALHTQNFNKVSEQGILENVVITIDTVTKEGTEQLVDSKKIGILLETKVGNIKEKYLDDFIQLSFDVSSMDIDTKLNAKVMMYDESNKKWTDNEINKRTTNEIITKAGQLGEYALFIK